jgi:NADH-quinone oxidoreductase subunit K
VGVLIRRNALVVFMCIELMLNAVNLSLIAFSWFTVSFAGHAIVLLVIALAASEAAVGLAVIIALFRHKSTVDLDAMNLLRG